MQTYKKMTNMSAKEAVEFLSVRPEYEFDYIPCHFETPASIYEEIKLGAGHYIAILPIGWKSFAETVAKETIKPIYMGGSYGHTKFYGKFEFEPSPASFVPGVFYQFVYVKDGSSIFAQSKPFAIKVDRFCAPEAAYKQQASSALEKSPEKVLGMLMEHIRLEQAHRHLELAAMLGKLYTYQQHVVATMKHAPAIKAYLATVGSSISSSSSGGSLSWPLLGAKVWELLRAQGGEEKEKVSYYERMYAKKVSQKFAERYETFSSLRLAIDESERKIEQVERDQFVFYARFIESLKAKFLACASNLFVGGLVDEAKLSAFVNELWTGAGLKGYSHPFGPQYAEIAYKLSEIYAALGSERASWLDIIGAKFPLPKYSGLGAGGWLQEEEQEQEQQKEKYEKFAKLAEYEAKVYAFKSFIAGKQWPLFDRSFVRPLESALADLEAYLSIPSIDKNNNSNSFNYYYYYYAKRMLATFAPYRSFFGAKLSPSTAAWELRAQLRKLESEINVFYKQYESIKKISPGVVPIGLDERLDTLRMYVREKLAALAAFYDHIPSVIENVAKRGQMTYWMELLSAERRYVEAKASLLIAKQHALVHKSLFGLEKLFEVEAGEWPVRYMREIKGLRELFEWATFGAESSDQHFVSASWRSPLTFVVHQHMHKKLMKLIVELNELYSAYKLAAPTGGDFAYFTRYLDHFYGTKPVSYFKTLLGGAGKAYKYAAAPKWDDNKSSADCFFGGEDMFGYLKAYLKDYLKDFLKPEYEEETFATKSADFEYMPTFIDELKGGEEKARYKTTIVEYKPFAAVPASYADDKYYFYGGKFFQFPEFKSKTYAGDYDFENRTFSGGDYSKTTFADECKSKAFAGQFDYKTFAGKMYESLIGQDMFQGAAGFNKLDEMTGGKLYYGAESYIPEAKEFEARLDAEFFM